MPEKNTPFAKARFALDSGAHVRTVVAEILTALEAISGPQEVPVTVQAPAAGAESQTPPAL